MRKAFILLAALILAAPCVRSQTTTETLRVTRVRNVSSASTIIDNRSAWTRQNDYHSFCASGTGTWSVQLQHATVPTGPWVNFAAGSSVTNASPTCVGVGIGYYPFLRFSITGTALVTYSGAKWFYAGAGGGSGTGTVIGGANVGTGAGLYDDLNAGNLEFRSLNAASNKVSITLDAVGRKVDVDVSVPNIMAAVTANQIPDLSATYALAARGVTNGDAHDHAGGDGAQISYGSLANVPANFAPSPHAGTHATGQVDALSPSDIGAVADGDPRLSDARTPTAHAASHGTGQGDALTPASIGAVATGDLAAHTGNTSNPHSVTAAQVGAPTTATFTAHSTSTANPHAVSADQVGNTVAQWNADQIQGAAVPDPGALDDLKMLQYSHATGEMQWATPSTEAVWGSITGTLSAQTDLQNALNAKSATSHTHTSLTLATLALNADYTVATLPAGVNRQVVTVTDGVGPFDCTIGGGSYVVMCRKDGVVWAPAVGPPLGGAATWGAITGTLSDQTDLQGELDAKAAAADLTTHTGATDNPHAVTAAQVGSATAQWNADKIQGSAVPDPGVTEDQKYLQYDHGTGAYVWASPAGSGDVSSNTATSVEDEVALFADTGGKTLKRATTTGVAKLTSGVLSTVTGDSAYCVKVDGTSGPCGTGGSLSDFTPTVTTGDTTNDTISVAAGKINIGNSFNSLAAGAVKFTNGGAGGVDCKVFVSDQAILTVHCANDANLAATPAGSAVFAKVTTPGYGTTGHIGYPVADLTISSGDDPQVTLDGDARAFANHASVTADTGIVVSTAGGVQAVGIDTASVPRLGASNDWTGANDFSAGTIRIRTGTETPPSAGCDAAAEVGNLYAHSDPAAANSTLYVCSNTGASTYAWELVQGSGGGGSGAPTDAQYLTLATNSTLTAERVLTPRDSLTATDGGANGTYTLDFTPHDMSVFTFREEFCGGSTSSGALGDHGWTLTQISTAGTFDKNFSGQSGHPCTVLLKTGTTSNGGPLFYLGPGLNYLGLDNLTQTEFEANYVFQFATIPTDKAVRIGFGSQTGATPENRIVAKFESDSDTNWYFETCSSSKCSTSDSGVAAGNTNWVRLRIYRNSGDTAGTVRMCLNACSSPTQMTTNVPTGDMTPMFIWVNDASGTTDQSLRLDFFSLKIRGLSRW